MTDGLPGQLIEDFVKPLLLFGGEDVEDAPFSYCRYVVPLFLDVLVILDVVIKLLRNHPFLVGRKVQFSF